MPKFVILKHECPNTADHWDFMLEQPDHLTCWQLPLAPPQWGHSPIEMTKIFDHRKKYLTYEGDISKSRGRVTQVDHGEYRCITKSKDEWHIEIQGTHVKGMWQIIKRKDDQWVLKKDDIS